MSLSPSIALRIISPGVKDAPPDGENASIRDRIKGGLQSKKLLPEVLQGLKVHPCQSSKRLLSFLVLILDILSHLS